MFIIYVNFFPNFRNHTIFISNSSIYSVSSSSCVKKLWHDKMHACSSLSSSSMYFPSLVSLILQPSLQEKSLVILINKIISILFTPFQPNRITNHIALCEWTSHATNKNRHLYRRKPAGLAFAWRNVLWIFPGDNQIAMFFLLLSL